jgi:hypothetical protein
MTLAELIIDVLWLPAIVAFWAWARRARRAASSR